MGSSKNNNQSDVDWYFEALPIFKQTSHNRKHQPVIWTFSLLAAFCGFLSSFLNLC